MVDQHDNTRKYKIVQTILDYRRLPESSSIGPSRHPIFVWCFQIRWNSQYMNWNVHETVHCTGHYQGTVVVEANGSNWIGMGWKNLHRFPCNLFSLPAFIGLAETRLERCPTREQSRQIHQKQADWSAGCSWDKKQSWYVRWVSWRRLPIKHMGSASPSPEFCATGYWQDLCSISW